MKLHFSLAFAVLLAIQFCSSCVSAVHAPRATTVVTSTKSEHNEDKPSDIPTSLARGGATTATVTAVAKRKLTSIDLALAGALATMIGDASMHPIDCIKTLQQSNEGIGLNMVAAAKRIWKTNGVGGFYSGIATYVISDGMAGAIKFAT